MINKHTAQWHLAVAYINDAARQIDKRMTAEERRRIADTALEQALEALGLLEVLEGKQ